MKRIFGSLFLALIMLGSTALAETGGSTTDLVVLGRAPANENAALGRKQAIDNALRQAVGKVAIQMVDPATLRAKLKELDENILVRFKNFVGSFTPLAVSLETKDILVLVSVQVNKAALDQALSGSGLRLPVARLTEALVLVAEEASPQRPAVYWWSGMPGVPKAPIPVAKTLNSLGIKQSEISPLIGQVPASAKTPVLTEEQAFELGRLAGAGLVLLGRVRTYPLITPEGKTPDPVAQLELLDVEANKVLGMDEVEGPVWRTTPGPSAQTEVAKAVEQAVRGLLEKVTGEKGETEIASASGDLVLTVTGIRTQGQLYQFQQALNSLTAIVTHSRRQSTGAGKAELALKIKAPASQLADMLLLQQFKGFLVNVLEIEPHSMKVVLIPR